jgi:cell wall-associated NlpC family hydrolase
MTVVTADPLKPGMLFLYHGESWVSRSISSAQAFVRGGSFYSHAGLYLGDGKIIEAMPSGARICDFSPAYDHATVLWSDAPIQRALASGVVDEAELRARVVEEARKLEGTPYSYSDYLAIAAVEWKWPGWEKLRSYVASSGRLICSALVDRAFLNAGVHLFDDRRLPGDVTPGDLDRYDQHWVRERLGSVETRLRRIETHLGLDQWVA